MIQLFTRVGKFGLVGLLGVGVNFVLFILFRDTFAIPDLLAKSLAIELSILHNFAWNFAWTWADRGRSLRSLWQRLLKYHGSTFVASYVVTIVVSYAMRWWVVGRVQWEEILGFLPFLSLTQEQWVAYLSYLVGIAAGMVANFIMADRWVFKAREGAGETD